MELVASPPPRFLRSQRWRERRQVYVPNDTVIDPRDFAVDIIPCKIARAFVIAHHYTQSFPASRLSVGLFRNGKGGRPALVGVSTYSVPMSNAAIPLHTGLADHRAGADLGRLVLDHDVAGNGETWFVARGLKLLRATKPEIQAVIAYADPAIRRDRDGRIYQRGHVGAVYGALYQGSYRGRGARRTLLLTPDGQTFSARAASKIRNGETGQGYAIDQLIRAGAPGPALGQSPSDWFKDLVAGPFFTRFKHDGCHVYSFPLTRTAKRAASKFPTLQRPRRDPTIAQGDVTALPLFDV